MTLAPIVVPAIVPDVSVDQMSRLFQHIEKSSPVSVTQLANEPVQYDITEDQAIAHETVVRSVFVRIKQLAENRCVCTE